MDQFNELVSTQMKTMDRLLYLQSELECFQQIEHQLISLRQDTKLEGIREEIDRIRIELGNIHSLFEAQTEDVIRSFQETTDIMIG